MIKNISVILCLTAVLSGCSDFFDEDSDYIINAEGNHLVGRTDTLYSVTGILNKMQAIGDRTILLGEARGDLVSVTDATSADLRNLANFDIDDSNMYNTPRDYYAIINNCNYYIANADTSLTNNRQENLFLNEYAAVKAIRAWTYLQLVSTYGKVPFVTDPVLTKEQAELDYPMKDIKGVCDYFLNEDGLQALALNDKVTYPEYGNIKGLPSKLFYVPLYLVLGDLNLWAGNYMEAAKNYSNYLVSRNGVSYSYAIQVNKVEWTSQDWLYSTDSWTQMFGSGVLGESVNEDAEIISMIPMDSIQSEGYYSQLRNIFNTYPNTDKYAASLVPSKSLKNLSASQTYCYYNDFSDTFIPVPKGLEGNMDGDLRLAASCITNENATMDNGTRYSSQYVRKYQTRNIHVYRRALVYLRMAEALNRAGYPRFAYHILATGINDRVIADSVATYYPNDSVMLCNTFSYPVSRYVLVRPEYSYLASTANTMGLHDRGCGYSPMNDYYKMPEGTLEEQMEAVEDMIVDEEALEFAFEGYRYYDLLRVALRRGDNEYLAGKIAYRNGERNGDIYTKLLDQKNWFLHWNNQIGY